VRPCCSLTVVDGVVVNPLRRRAASRPGSWGVRELCHEVLRALVRAADCTGSTGTAHSATERLSKAHAPQAQTHASPDALHVLEGDVKKRGRGWRQACHHLLDLRIVHVRGERAVVIRPARGSISAPEVDARAAELAGFVGVVVLGA
jgi:hypothetical protein